jgi:hypothetical protein
MYSLYSYTMKTSPFGSKHVPLNEHTCGWLAIHISLIALIKSGPCACMYVCMRVRTYAWVRKRAHRKQERERKCVCVCVYI